MPLSQCHIDKLFPHLLPFGGYKSVKVTYNEFGDSDSPPMTVSWSYNTAKFSVVVTKAGTSTVISNGQQLFQRNAIRFQHDLHRIYMLERSLLLDLLRPQQYRNRPSHVQRHGELRIHACPLSGIVSALGASHRGPPSFFGLL